MGRGFTIDLVLWKQSTKYKKTKHQECSLCYADDARGVFFALHVAEFVRIPSGAGLVRVLLNSCESSYESIGSLRVALRWV